MQTSLWGHDIEQAANSYQFWLQLKKFRREVVVVYDNLYHGGDQ